VSVIVLALAVLLLGVQKNFCSARESTQQVKISATYDVELGSFNLGDFKLNAKLDGSSYELKAKGKFSLVSSMLYSASGRTEASGKLSNGEVEPSRFNVTYQGGSKKEERSFDFVNGAVSQVSVVPAKRPSPRSVPVTAEQLTNVLDPLTAGFMSVRAKNGSDYRAVCEHTIPVFDGKQRFDIVLTPKRSEPVPQDGPSGMSGPLAVCRAKFVPISGYRPDHPGVKFMSQTEDIEVWLVSIPRTNFHIPYRIVLPTAWANGVASLRKIELR
jgi:hypothetical protein